MNNYMKKIGTLGLLLLLPVLSFGQGAQRISQVTMAVNGFVKTVPGARITVCAYTISLACVTPVSIYSNVALTLPLSNPFNADSSGNFSYYLPAGTYVESVTAAGAVPRSYAVTLGGTGGVESVTASTPLASSGGTTPNISIGVAQGNGPKVQLAAGTATSGNCPEYDANGNLVDSGSPCASGDQVSSGSQYQVPYYDQAGSNAHLGPTPGVTTDSTGNILQVQGGVAVGSSPPSGACTSSDGALCASQSTNYCTPTPGVACLSADSTNNVWLQSLNGGSLVPVPNSATAPAAISAGGAISVSLGTNSAPGVLQCDGTTTTCSAGIISSNPGPGTPSGSIQWNNSGVLAGIAQWSTNGTTTITAGATGVLDMHSAPVLTGLLFPTAAGAAPTVAGNVAFDTTTNRIKQGDGSTSQTVTVQSDFGAQQPNPGITTCSAISGTCTYTNAFLSNPKTGTYQVLAADFAGCKQIPVASGTFTITLVASGSQPPAGQCLWIENYGSGVVTVARSGQNINGAASNLTLAAGSSSSPTGVFVVSDGTNYFAQPVGASGSSGVSSFTGDGTLISNSGSTGAVTTTLANAAAHKYWGNNTGSTGAPGYNSLVAADLPDTAVTAGSYINANITVDAQGRLTSASSGAGSICVNQSSGSGQTSGPVSLISCTPSVAMVNGGHYRVVAGISVVTTGSPGNSPQLKVIQNGTSGNILCDAPASTQTQTANVTLLGTLACEFDVTGSTTGFSYGGFWNTSAGAASVSRGLSGGSVGTLALTPTTFDIVATQINANTTVTGESILVYRIY